MLYVCTIQNQNLYSTTLHFCSKEIAIIFIISFGIRNVLIVRKKKDGFVIFCISKVDARLSTMNGTNYLFIFYMFPAWNHHHIFNKSHLRPLVAVHLCVCSLYRLKLVVMRVTQQNPDSLTIETMSAMIGITKNDDTSNMDLPLYSNFIH